MSNSTDTTAIAIMPSAEQLKSCNSIGDVRRAFKASGLSGKGLTAAVNGHKAAFHQNASMAVTGLQAKGFQFTSAKRTKSGDYSLKLSRPAAAKPLSKKELIAQIERLQAELAAKQIQAPAAQ
jgi:hypothetical protein